MPTHAFSIELANRIGVEKAILVHHLAYWQLSNQANNRNCHEGKFWTFNTSKAFSEILSYFSQSKVKRLLKELEEKDEIVVSGVFNRLPFDRTKWYSIIDPEAMSIYNLLDSSDLNDGTTDIEPTIPDSKPNINHISADDDFSAGRTPEDIIENPSSFLTDIVKIVQFKADRAFSTDHKWLQRFRNDLGSLVAELDGDHDRIMKAMKWYMNNDCMIIIDSGRCLKDKFSKIENLMKGKRGFPADETDEKRKNVCKKPGIVEGVKLPAPWRCKCGTLNSMLDDKCECGLDKEQAETKDITSEQ